MRACCTTGWPPITVTAEWSGRVRIQPAAERAFVLCWPDCGEPRRCGGLQSAGDDVDDDDDATTARDAIYDADMTGSRRSEPLIVALDHQYVVCPVRPIHGSELHTSRALLTFFFAPVQIFLQKLRLFRRDLKTFLFHSFYGHQDTN